jgi:CSLREA domain-containing protein
MRIKKLFISLILGLGLTLALLWLLGGGLSVVRAADFTVDTTTDEKDTSCTDGDCSLRDAIIIANGNGQADTITLPSGTYALTLTGTGEDAAATGDLDVTNPLTITGAGPSQTTIDASGVISDRVFDIKSGAGTVVISGVKVINGNVTGSGGGINNYNADLTLINTVVVSNTASGYPQQHGQARRRSARFV